MRSGYCTKTKQEWPDSGSTLEIFFVVFTKLIPRRIFFFCIANILVLMVGPEIEHKPFFRKLFGHSCCVFPAEPQSPNGKNINVCAVWALHSWDIPAKSRDIPAKSRDIPGVPEKFGFPGFEGHTELFAPPTPSRGRPHPTRRYPDSKFGFGFLCRADYSGPFLNFLLTISLLTSEDFSVFPDFPSDRTFLGGLKKTLQSLRNERKTPEILTN